MRHRVSILALAIVAGALSAGVADAAPTFELRSDNAVTLRGVVAEAPAPVTKPQPSTGFRLLLESHPLDGSIAVACDAEIGADCARLLRGDRVLLMGEIRVVDGIPLVLARKVDKKDGGDNE